MPKKKTNYWKLAISILVCLLAGFIGSFFTFSSVSTWYATLNKPFFNPPSWLFGPVWTILYLLMGISLYLVWEKGIKGKESKIALSIFGVQLFLNLLWSIIFFAVQSPLYAFIEIILLWITIVITMIYFYRISKPATYLLIPYILWVTFAAVLNFSIYYLN